jgi:hypothetical protein
MTRFEVRRSWRFCPFFLSVAENPNGSKSRSGSVLTRPQDGTDGQAVSTTRFGDIGRTRCPNGQIECQTFRHRGRPSPSQISISKRSPECRSLSWTRTHGIRDPLSYRAIFTSVCHANGRFVTAEPGHCRILPRNRGYKSYRHRCSPNLDIQYNRCWND